MISFFRKQKSGRRKNLRESPQEEFPFLRFSDLTILITLTAALLYTAGWTYARHYFLYFEIGLMGLEIPKEYFFQYGWEVFLDRIWIASFFYLLLAGGIFVRGKVFFEDAGHWRLALWLVGSLFLLLLFLGAVQIGKNSAQDRLREQRGNYFSQSPSIQVELKTDWVPEKLQTLDLEIAKKGEYRLLLQTKTHLYLFLLPEKKLLEEAPNLFCAASPIFKTRLLTGPCRAKTGRSKA